MRRGRLSCGILLLIALLAGCSDPGRPVPAARSGARAEPPAPTSSVRPLDPTASPAVNWVLPIFTDREGYRSMTLRGSAVRPNTDGSIAVEDLSITIFDGKPEPKVDTVLLSPTARFFPKENRASGDKAVRLIRDDIEVNGVGWTYDHATKKVSLHHNVRVTFRAQVNDILK